MRNKPLLTAIVVFFAVLLHPPQLSADDPPRSKEELLKRLKQAINIKSPIALRNLYYLEGVDEQTASLINFTAEVLIETGANKYEFAELPDDFRSEIILQGNRYVANVEVQGLIIVRNITKSKDAFSSLPYGERDGYFYFPGTIKENLNDPSQGEGQISLEIHGTLAPEPVEVEGSCVYLLDGEEFSREIFGPGGMIEIFFADSIKSCNVKKVSDVGGFKLILRERQKIIFESKYRDTDEPILFNAE